VRHFLIDRKCFSVASVQKGFHSYFDLIKHGLRAAATQCMHAPASVFKHVVTSQSELLQLAMRFRSRFLVHARKIDNSS